MIRNLIDKIVLTPVEHQGHKTLSIDLYGDIGGILSMATESEKPHRKDGFAEESIKLVAGARYQPFRTPVSAFVPILG